MSLLIVHRRWFDDIQPPFSFCDQNYLASRLPSDDCLSFVVVDSALLVCVYRYADQIHLEAWHIDDIV